MFLGGKTRPLKGLKKRSGRPFVTGGQDRATEEKLPLTNRTAKPRWSREGISTRTRGAGNRQQGEGPPTSNWKLTERLPWEGALPARPGRGGGKTVPVPTQRGTACGGKKKSYAIVRTSRKKKVSKTHLKGGGGRAG